MKKLNTPISDKSKIEVFHGSSDGSGWLYAVDVNISRNIEREKEFYRDLLEQVCQDSRKTRARRLAESGLMFWDQLQAEKIKRANNEKA